MNSTSAMAPLRGGRFWMGSDDHYPEERPCREVTVAPFEIDIGPVSNRDFARFVAATGYVTVAERPLDPADYPGADPSLLEPGAAVFMSPEAGRQVADRMDWWHYVPGASWRHPTGPDSGIDDLENHPVVQIACEDAEAFAHWAGKRLPTEAEWEFAARGGLDRKPYAWGDALEPGGAVLANYWQGQFPVENLLRDGWARTSPIGQFPANGFGLFDVIGNVWEWTADWYGERPAKGPACCAPDMRSDAVRAASHDPHDAGRNFPRRVLKGGSHLCADNYCRRYRPAARYPQTIDTSTSHIGFRCARDAADGSQPEG